MDPPQELTACSNVSIQGQTICTEAATTELVAADFNYPTIQSNEDKLTLPTVVELSGITPEFVGGPDEATYLFTSVKSSSPETWFDLSEYGMALNKDTGEITGTPTKFLAKTDIIIKAYHIESGQWLSYEFNMAIATNFAVDGRTIVYPFPEAVPFERLRLSVSDASIFSTCSEQTCFTTSSGVKGYIEHIDSERNLLFVKVAREDRLSSDWAKEVISVGENIENGNDFIASSSTIDEVVRTIDLSEKISHYEYRPYFNFELTTESEEWKELRWSISPLPPGGIRDGKQTDHGFQLVYKDDETPGNMGVLFWKGQDSPEKPQEYTISVKNSIGQILQTKVMLNFERPPEGLGVSNFALVEVNQYEKIYVGDYISTSEEDLAKVYHKTFTTYQDESRQKQYKYYLMVKLIKGDFTDKEEIDHFKNYSRSVASVVGEPELVNNVLTINPDSGTEFNLLGSDGEISDEKLRYISQNNPSSDAISPSTLKLVSEPLQTIEVINPAQFSVGLQIVDEEDNSAVVTGIFETTGNADSNEDGTFVVVQPTKGSLIPNKKIQLGKAKFDQTEESTDYIKSSSMGELQNIFILSTHSESAKIDNLFDVTSTANMKIAQSKSFQSGGAKNIISLWSPILKLWSEESGTVDPFIKETFKFSSGSDVFTYSRLSGVVNKRDKSENSIYIEMDQFGFLPHLQDITPDGDTARPFHFTFSEYHQDKSNLATDAQNQILRNDMDYDNNTNKDPNVSAIQLGMSPTFVVYRGENLNIKSQTHYGGNMDYFLEPAPETLPDGLSYDPTNGTISGIPTEKLDATKYTITARNPLGSVSYDFYLQIKDRMLIENVTVSESDYMLHKMGQSRQHVDCQITEEQIKNFQVDERDILCTLDVPENDLRNSEVNLKVDIGNNICEYMEFKPYSFNSLLPNLKYEKTGTEGILESWTKIQEVPTEPFAGELVLARDGSQAEISDLAELKKIEGEGQYARIFRNYSVPEGCDTCYHPELKRTVACDDLKTQTPSCIGDHSAENGPNCDDGKYIVRTITIGEDLNPDDENDVEDKICGYSESIPATYNLAFLKDTKTFDPVDPKTWAYGSTPPDIKSSTNKELDKAFFPIIESFLTSNKLMPHNKLYLEKTIDGIINQDDDVTGDGIADAFAYFKNDAGKPLLVHINTYLHDSANNRCQNAVDATPAVAFEAGGVADVAFWNNLDPNIVGLPEGDLVASVALSESGKRLILKLTTNAGVELEFSLIQQPNMLVKKGGNITDATQIEKDNFYFLVDGNCDGVNDSALTVDINKWAPAINGTGHPDPTPISPSILAYGLPFGVESPAVDELRGHSDYLKLINPLLFLDDDTFPDSIDRNIDTLFSKDKDVDGDDDVILTFTIGQDATWGEVSSDEEETVTSCGGSYDACLMGQAKTFLSESDISIGTDGKYYDSITSFSQEFLFQNTDPTRPFAYTTSWDIANYYSNNSCAFSPNLFFESVDNEFTTDSEADTTDAKNGTSADNALAIHGDKLSQVSTFGSTGNLLEELLSNRSLPYDNFSENLNTYTAVIGLGDLAVRDVDAVGGSVEINNIIIPKKQVAKKSDDNDTFTIQKIGEGNNPGEANAKHTTSFELLPTLENNNVDVYYVNYSNADYASGNYGDGEHALSEKINYYDQEVGNWAKVKNRSYIAIYAGTTADLDEVGVGVANFEQFKNSIGLELITDTYVVRLEGYLENKDTTVNDFIIVSIHKDYQDEFIDYLVEGGKTFSISNNKGSSAGNAVKNLFTTLDSDNQKYLPKIITTEFSSAHKFRPNPFYVFKCLDEAYDTKARITLQIREWNRHFTNGVDLDKSIPSAKMDNDSNDLFEIPYNDYPDLDDILGDSDSRSGFLTNSQYEGCLLKVPTRYNSEKSDSFINYFEP